MHAAAPDALYRPTTQAEHARWPASLYFPAAHTPQIPEAAVDRIEYPDVQRWRLVDDDCVCLAHQLGSPGFRGNVAEAIVSQTAWGYSEARVDCSSALQQYCCETGRSSAQDDVALCSQLGNDALEKEGLACAARCI